MVVANPKMSASPIGVASMLPQPQTIDEKFHCNCGSVLKDQNRKRVDKHFSTLKHRQWLANWLMDDVRLKKGLKFGKHTVTISTLIKSSGDVAPANAGDISYVTTGGARLQYHNGSVRTVVNTDESQTLASKSLTAPAITGAPTAVGATWADLGQVTQIDINGGNIDDVEIGGTTPAAFAGTTGAFSGAVTAATAPSNGNHLVNKTYADGIAAGLDPKQSVVAATLVAGILADDFENLDVIDGIALATGDRILIKDQASGTENGIYVVEVTGAPTRADDMPTGSGASGAHMFVEEGSQGDSQWVCTDNTGEDVVGTDALTFSIHGTGAGPGAGMVLNGSDHDVVAADTSMTINADDLQVNLAADPGLEISSGVKVKAGTDISLTAGGVNVDSASDASGGNSIIKTDGSGNCTVNELTTGDVKFANDWVMTEAWEDGTFGKKGPDNQLKSTGMAFLDKQGKQQFQIDDEGNLLIRGTVKQLPNN